MQVARTALCKHEHRRIEVCVSSSIAGRVGGRTCLFISSSVVRWGWSFHPNKAVVIGLLVVSRSQLEV